MRIHRPFWYIHALIAIFSQKLYHTHTRVLYVHNARATRDTKQELSEESEGDDNSNRPAVSRFSDVTGPRSAFVGGADLWSPPPAVAEAPFCGPQTLGKASVAPHGYGYGDPGRRPAGGGAAGNEDAGCSRKGEPRS